MRILVIGAAGMLGSDVLAHFEGKGFVVSGVDQDTCDLTNPLDIASRLAEGWDWVVNCAAYTAVDRAETERDAALAVNGLGPGYLAQACALHQVKLLHVSTDFVFDGTKRIPYEESDPTAPLGMYGYSKRVGEEAVAASGAHAIIVRTAWLFGPNGGSFPRTIINAAKSGRTLRVVCDQVGSPTYTGDLARVICDLIEVDPPAGIYHAAGPEAMSWFDLAKASVKAASLDVPIDQIATDDWPTPAPRPAYSVLSFAKCESLGIEPMRTLADTLPEFVSRISEP